jgi:L-seryl-tRNA(Ser) seleniumtransferase
MSYTSAVANPAQSDMYRKLPSVDELLRSKQFANLIQQAGHAAVANAARHVLGELRQAIAAGQLDEPGLGCAVGEIQVSIARQLKEDLSYSLRTVINATGVVLHTNLGRAPLARAAVEHIAETACAYSNLEYDIATGDRGRRDVHAAGLFARLFGRDDLSTVVVNNNAAAVLLCLNALAEGGEVVVSRGELVEIGGSFRIPEVMAKSGAILREVGTTNRTRIKDYEDAINERTRLLLRVHRSNFEIMGFTERPARKELVELGHRRAIPVMDDLGSGALVDLATVGIRGEPNVLEIVGEDMDVVSYSGDKMLGGPQAGLITGRRELVARVRANPLFRALRVDKLIYAALEATLLAYIRQDPDSIPAMRMMRASVEELQRRAEAVLEAVPRREHLDIEVRESESVPGGGSAPSATLPTRVLALRSKSMSADEIARLLRVPGTDPRVRGAETVSSETASHTPVIARVEQDLVLLDLRTVFPERDRELVRALERVESVCAERSSHPMNFPP